MRFTEWLKVKKGKRQSPKNVSIDGWLKSVDDLKHDVDELEKEKKKKKPEPKEPKKEDERDRKCVCNKKT